MSDQPHDNLRDNIGQAIKDAFDEIDAEIKGFDIHDARDIDIFTDKVMKVLSGGALTITKGDRDGNWQDFDVNGHGGMIRVVARMEDDDKDLPLGKMVEDFLLAASPATAQAPILSKERIKEIYRECYGCSPDEQNYAFADALLAAVGQGSKAAAEPDNLIQRICDAIRAADNKGVDEADYMLDSDDCIKIIEEFAARDTQSLAGQLSAAMGSYLHRCRSGGMPKRSSDRIQAAFEKMIRVGYLDSIVVPQPHRLSRATIRSIFLENGFTIKEGQSDLKPYVFEAADALLEAARKGEGKC